MPMLHACRELCKEDLPWQPKAPVYQRKMRMLLSHCRLLGEEMHRWKARYAHRQEMLLHVSTRRMRPHQVQWWGQSDVLEWQVRLPRCEVDLQPQALQRHQNVPPARQEKLLLHVEEEPLLLEDVPQRNERSVDSHEDWHE